MAVRSPPIWTEPEREMRITKWRMGICWRDHIGEEAHTGFLDLDAIAFLIDLGDEVLTLDDYLARQAGRRNAVVEAIREGMSARS